MILIRPCRANDLLGIERLVRENQTRISSLPRERESLSARIDHALRSFAQEPAIAGSEFFLFVMEDTETGDLLGTSGVAVNADQGRPFYSYRLDKLIHSSPTWGVKSAFEILYLTHELTGSAVLSSLAIQSDYRGTDYFELLSRSRLLFIGQFNDCFGEQLVVEIQGVLDDHDSSAFWDSLGRHFFNMDFATADYFTSIKSRTTIAEMMPAHPIYVQLLSEAAQAVIAQPDDRARDAYELLLREGFKLSRYIDIFDGGPTLLAAIEHLASVTEAQHKVLSDLPQAPTDAGSKCLVANHSLADFRCGLVQVTEGPGATVCLDEVVAEHLQIGAGESICYVPL